MINPIATTNTISWTDQQWPGNPKLGLSASCKLFKNPFNGRVTPVWVHGGTKDCPSFYFTVSAGSYSDWSYTGGVPVEVKEMNESQKFVNQLYDNDKLFI